MDRDHYTIPGYHDCIEQAAETLRREIARLQSVRHAGGLQPERIESMLAWRRSLLVALAPSAGH